MERGKFIVFEGIEGSGKSTQAELLYQYMKDNEIPVYLTKEPSDGPIGELCHKEYLSGKQKTHPEVINKMIRTDRVDHVLNKENGILLMIENGINVISDRYAMSDFAYANIENLSYPKFAVETISQCIKENKIALSYLIPDITFFVDTDPKVCMDRINARNDTKEIYDNIESLERLQKSYKFYLYKQEEIKEDHIIKLWPYFNTCIVDGNGNATDIHKYIVNVLNFKED